MDFRPELPPQVRTYRPSPLRVLWCTRGAACADRLAGTCRGLGEVDRKIGRKVGRKAGRKDGRQTGRQEGRRVDKEVKDEVGRKWKCRQEGRREGGRQEGKKVGKYRQTVVGPAGRTFKREI